MKGWMNIEENTATAAIMNAEGGKRKVLGTTTAD